MPSTSQPSPYAEPNTPIASAKRPRTAIRHTGTPHGKHGASQGSSHLLQSPPPACQLEQPSPNAEADATEREQQQQQQKQQHRRRACEGAGNDMEGNEGAEGSWKGRVVSLFSPVLKLVGGHQQGEADAEEDGAERNPSGEGDENDLNVENRAAGGPRGLQLHKEGSGTASAGDAMEVEAPLTEGEEEEEGQEDGEEGEEEQGDENEGEELDVVEEFNPFLFIKQLPPYEHVRVLRINGYMHACKNARCVFLNWPYAPSLPTPTHTSTNQVAIPGKICLPQRAVAAATGAKYNTRSGAPAAQQQPPPPVTLVLDLDETLVHCTVEPVPDPDMVFPVEFNGVQYQVHVRKRPHLEEFLARVAKMFEVVVFTASQQVRVLDWTGLDLRGGSTPPPSTTAVRIHPSISLCLLLLASQPKTNRCTRTRC